MVKQEQTSLAWLDEEINSSAFGDRCHASRFKCKRPATLATTHISR